MTEEEIFKLPFNERQHFIQCRACGDWYDLKNIDKIIIHLDHRGGSPDNDQEIDIETAPQRAVGIS